ncbi:MAG TPA: phosphatidylinositol transfer protein [Polyangium sp.]|nr:phosphatidylinositol transfer protein [Polyangium sp.]
MRYRTTSILGSFLFLLALWGCGSGGSTDITTSGAGASGNNGGSGGNGNGGTGGGEAGSGGSTNITCPVIPACDAPLPDPGTATGWNSIIPPIGDPNHRGRDMFYNPGDAQWIMAKFSYGALDDDIKGEFVDMYLLRDCADTWEFLGTETTTEDGAHATVEGVEDTGGRLYYQIPKEKELGLGWHRVHFVVKGDLSTTDLYIHVVEKGAPLIVSDIDGTLTTYETEEFVALATGSLPAMQKDAANLFNIYAEKGYNIFYMTARPEWLGARTRAFFEQYGFPRGIVHTTLTKSGALGNEAATYKTNELKMVGDRGLVPSFAFGNTASDADAYFNAQVQPDDHRIFIQFDDTAHNGRRIEEYTELLGEAAALPSVCK